MMKRKMKMRNRLLLLTIGLWVVSSVVTVDAQEIKWLRVGELQSPINEIGAEYENEFPQGNTNYFSWPAQYGIDQNTTRMKAVWIGCKDFYDPVEKKLKSVKVIGSGPRNAPDRTNQIFEKEIKLIGRYYHPTVVVDEQRASALDIYDVLDDVDENLEADRMVLVKFNTSIGISVTKKVMAFAQPIHGNYFINDYIFKNTGIYDRAGNVHQQTLKEVWFYFYYRYAFAGVSSSGYGSTWGAFGSTWGASTLNHAFGENPAAPEFKDPTSPFFQMRGFYSYYGPHRESNQVQLSYEEDWGCPNYTGGDGVLGSAKYAGCVTLHADKAPGDPADDVSQPRTTWFIGSDINIVLANVSQYDEVFMADRYAAMSEGHPSKQHDEVVGNDYALNYTDPRRQTGGGTSQGQGFGPYTLAPGDSVHIVFAEGVAGLSWEKGREVGGNWIKWRNNVPDKPPLFLPDGSPAPDHNAYKKAWVFTGRDSILKTYRAAMKNYQSGYKIPQPPPPPQQFTVTSGGDRIQLKWADNAATDPHFDGYVIYRSEGNVLGWRTVYEKIFECNKSNVVHSFDDVTAKRGFDYYYYIQSKDDGTQNLMEPGKPLYSSLFWTVTSVPATLQRPAVTTTLDSVRVVPNPYDIRARIFQFGDQSQYDRIAFYGLPPVCKLKIYTERGDLIWEKDHTRGTGDELWDSMTSSGQIITSGIYLLYVEAPGGKSVIRKFVVIR
ncbi:MAG: hypothetical protein ONB44_00355 [candidate division KSB1 bacterium]|nr:hypothetical protein [candidate division KSB1 bacterium]MDZ7300572.1 hypothetical protein [candidate division KSB1 bacterium]MDZ7309709.1 hypothetical protein [candidate division KSB1 bacterium]